MALCSDEILEQVGQFGKYQIRIIVMCGAIVFFTSQPAFLPTFIGVEPPWKCVINSTFCNKSGVFHYEDPFYESRCDMPRDAWEFDTNRVTYTTEWDLVCEKAALVSFALSMVNLGSLVGLIILGVLGDKFGRKQILFGSFFVAFVFRVVSAVASSLWLMVFCQFIVGAFGVASTMVAFSLSVECAGAKYRGTAGTVVWYGYTLGLLAIPLVDWFMTDWRHVSLVLATPSVICMFFWWFLPESPRWLLTEGRCKEALKIYQEIARVNGKQIPSGELKEPSMKSSEAEEYSSHNMLDLFRPCRTATITLVVSFTAFSVGFVYSGVSYNSDYIGGGVHLNFALQVLSEIPATLISTLLMNRIGRKPVTCGFMILASLFSVAVSLMPYNLTAVRVLMAVLAKMTITTAYCAVDVQEAEVFPTQVRNMGLGVAWSIDALGWTAASYVMLLQSIHVVLPFVVMGTLALTAGLLSIILPETRNQPTLEFVKRTAEIAQSPENNEIYNSLIRHESSI